MLYQTRPLEARTILSLLVLQLLFVGCQPAQPTKPVADDDILSLPQVTNSTFKKKVLQNSKPVLVEVGVNYGCPACESMKPQVSEVARQLEGQIEVLQVHFRSEQALVQQLGVSQCPTYLIFSQGRLKKTIKGETSADVLIDRLNEIR